MPGTAIGFWRGFVAPFGALRQLLGLPRAWPLMLVPVVVFGLLEALVVGASWHFLKPWVSSWLAGEGALRQIGASAASWLAVALAALVGWLLAGFLAPVVSAPALERIVSLTEVELGVPARAPLGFVAEFWCGFRSLLMSTAVTLPLIVGLTLLEMVVPPAAVATTPLKLLLAALGLAWGLFDYPLTLRGIGARARFAFMRRHFSVVLGFGAAFSLVFMLPCCGLFMLPVGVAAATRLYWQIERAQ
jgi:uncharacterized protein involved in cysteine biosynthesis